MNKRQALKIDTELEVDFDEDSSMFCVFGNKSRFAYASEMTKEHAIERLGEILDSQKSK